MLGLGLLPWEFAFFEDSEISLMVQSDFGFMQKMFWFQVLIKSSIIFHLNMLTMSL